MSGLADIQSMQALKNSKKNSKTNKFSYNLDNTLINFRVALSNAQNQLVKIFCLGDSITRGEYSSDEPNKSWVGQLRNLMQSQFGGIGEGFINIYESTLPTGAKPRWTLGAGWSISTAYNSGGGLGGYWGYSATSTNTSPSSVTFKGTSVSIVYPRTTDGGTANILIDGVSKGTLNCHNTVSDFTQFMLITGLTDGAHTMSIVPNGDGKIFLEGIIEGAGNTTGVQVNRLGRSGWQASDWLNNKTTNFQRWGAYPPHLTFIALGMNDCKTATVSNYMSYMGQLISEFQSLGSSVILLPYQIPDTSWTSNSNYLVFVNAQYQLADQYNCGLIDIYKAWGQTYSKAQSLGLFGVATNDYSGVSGTNPAHPGDKGYNYIAQIIKPYLTI